MKVTGKESGSAEMNENQLPATILGSKYLGKDDIHLLCNRPEIPMIDPAFEDDQLKNIVQYFSNDPDEMEKEIHKYASQLLHAGKADEAWQVLLTCI